MRSRMLLFLVVLIFGPSLPSLAQDLGSTRGVKENLDLPVDSGGVESGTEAPETLVLFGHTYEGDGFFFVSGSVP